MDERRDAERESSPGSPGDLRDVFWRLAAQIRDDRVTLVAAGVTFYLILSLFPAMATLVSIYGLVSDPATIANQISFLSAVLPAESLKIVTDQLNTLASQTASSLSIGFLVGLLVALWSARNGVSALFEAMNIAYDEEEKRGIVRLTLLSLGFTLGGLLLIAVLIAAIAVLPAFFALFPGELWLENVAKLVRWPVLVLVLGAAIMVLYRYGPSREPGKLKWLAWGVGFSLVSWLAASVLFSYYIDNFANYNATYGTLGAAIGFMLWIWLSTLIVIVGAELNAVLEKTARVSRQAGAKD
ncbi:YihY/virulence factor BrkB family protein [Ensifer sp. LCM 4579]|uniref:YihY/virulence factor BrkB family protein n=1 Tax=Ensifer sp. LCM 4579 TaxID=1848292 RepID=UPI0008DAD3B1|nr:YihY/virulence factor BrkB family protein [Ensifer sp. LCM 4579]OHV81018.1 ribonuclease [Ensifer sp. LCM 4579]